MARSDTIGRVGLDVFTDCYGFPVCSGKADWARLLLGHFFRWRLIGGYNPSAPAASVFETPEGIRVWLAEDSPMGEVQSIPLRVFQPADVAHQMHAWAHGGGLEAAHTGSERGFSVSIPEIFPCPFELRPGDWDYLIPRIREMVARDNKGVGIRLPYEVWMALKEREMADLLWQLPEGVGVRLQVVDSRRGDLDDSVTLYMLVVNPPGLVVSAEMSPLSLESEKV